MHVTTLENPATLEYRRQFQNTSSASLHLNDSITRPLPESSSANHTAVAFWFFCIPVYTLRVTTSSKKVLWMWWRILPELPYATKQCYRQTCWQEAKRTRWERPTCLQSRFYQYLLPPYKQSHCQEKSCVWWFRAGGSHILWKTNVWPAAWNQLLWL